MLVATHVSFCCIHACVGSFKMRIRSSRAVRFWARLRTACERRIAQHKKGRYLDRPCVRLCGLNCVQTCRVEYQIRLRSLPHYVGIVSRREVPFDTQTSDFQREMQ